MNIILSIENGHDLELKEFHLVPGKPFKEIHQVPTELSTVDA